MRLDRNSSEIFNKAYKNAIKENYEYITPEYILFVALDFEPVQLFLEELGVNMGALRIDLETYLNEHVTKIENDDPINSVLLDNILNNVAFSKSAAGKDVVTFSDILLAIFDEEKSHASYFLRKQGIKKSNILDAIVNKEWEDEDYYVEDEMDEDELPISYIEKFTTDLTLKAKSGELDPLIGRTEELNRTMQVLLRRNKNNPVHVGESGVGKTAITEGLAQLIAKGNVPLNLKDTRILSVDIAGLLAGTKYRGDFEERIKNLLSEVMAENNIILYIDEIHNLVGTGSNNAGAMDASNLLKPYFSSSDVRFIGSTTYDEYKKFISKDKALERRFQKIEILEPSVEESIKILKGLSGKYEKYHNVKYSEKAIIVACELSAKYLRDRFLPDKAIDLIDETAAHLRIVKGGDKKLKIGELEIEKTLAKLARIPEEKVESSELEKLESVDKKIKSVLFGQDHAVDIVVRSIRKSRAGFNDESKPIASMLFVGSTGVGKTELVKQLANNLDMPLIRFDMSEYQEKHAVAKLIGTPPGYVGFEQGGLLVEAIRKNPYSVLLLDEIEKAHSDIFNVLLQIMDYATLTENDGRKADFRNVILIMTSNAGATLSSQNIVGFGGGKKGNSTMKNALKSTFTPEFRNRLTDVVMFNKLNKDMIIEIVKNKINIFRTKLKKHKITITIPQNVYEYIANKSYSDEFGAREIDRYIDKEIKDHFVDEILFGKLKDGGKARLSVKNDKLVIN